MRLGYEIAYVDGSIKTVSKCKFKQLRKREDFEPFGKGLRQKPLIRRLMDWLTKMPPADIKNIEAPACKNLARVGTSYGNGNDQTRAMIDEVYERLITQDQRGFQVSQDDRQAWADWAAGVSK